MGIIPAPDDANVFTNLTAKGPSIIPDNSTLIARIIAEGTSGGISLAGVTANSINALVQNTIFEATVAMPNQTLLASNIVMVAGTASLTLGTTPNEGFLTPLVPSDVLQIVNQSTNALTINASVTNNTGASSLTKMGSGTAVLNGLNTYTGTTTLQEGTLEFSGPSIQTLSGNITGPGSLAKSGSGTLTLTFANTYTGPTTISAGILKAGNGAALGTIAAGTTITSGGTLDINGNNLGAEVVTVAGEGVGNAGAIINTGASATYALRFVTLTGDTTFGCPNRWDIRNNSTATFDMGGYTLTKIGVNEGCLINATVLNPGAINVLQGIYRFEGSTAMGGKLEQSGDGTEWRIFRSLEFFYDGRVVLGAFE
jgi:autotransporter-associated beta strand protein